MPNPNLTVEARYDDEAKVWYVADSDVPGLATEAETVDALIEKLSSMIPELLELNADLVDLSDAETIPFSVITHQEVRPAVA